MKSDEYLHLKEVISSSVFKNSTRYSRLLSYLYEAYCKGEKPKEVSIAVDVFGKNYDFDCSEDTLVRVSIYNLRKKLKQYYQEEGKNSKIQISIPKGGYTLLIEKKQNAKITWILIGVICLVSCLAFGISAFRVSIFEKIWSPIVKSNRNTMVVLGEHYFFNKYDSELAESSIQRIVGINSEKDLHEYIKNKEISNLPTTLSNNRYIGQNILEPFRSLCYSFGQHNLPLGYRFISNLTIPDLHDNNIIFVGEYKTCGILSNYLKKNGILCTERKGIYFEGLKDTLSPSVSTDICFVSKRINKNGTAFYMISSVHDTGMYRGISYLTEKVYLEEFNEFCETKFGYIPDAFNMLIEVKGVQRIGLSSKLLFIEERTDELEL